jgi:hypothetical protein
MLTRPLGFLLEDRTRRLIALVAVLPPSRPLALYFSPYSTRYISALRWTIRT